MDKDLNRENQDEKSLGYYMLDPEVNLLNINFATGENQFLNEHIELLNEEGGGGENR